MEWRIIACRCVYVCFYRTNPILFSCIFYTNKVPKAGDYKPWTGWVFHSVQEVHFTSLAGGEPLLKNGYSVEQRRNVTDQSCLLFQNETPGPGSYDCITSTELQSPSFSKKGTTGFVPSKVRAIGTDFRSAISQKQSKTLRSKASIQLSHCVWMLWYWFVKITCILQWHKNNFYLSSLILLLIWHISCHVLSGSLPELPVTHREESLVRMCTTCRGPFPTSVTSVLEPPGCSGCLWDCS